MILFHHSQNQQLTHLKLLDTSNGNSYHLNQLTKVISKSHRALSYQTRLAINLFNFQVFISWAWECHHHNCTTHPFCFSTSEKFSSKNTFEIVYQAKNSPLADSTQILQSEVLYVLALCILVNPNLFNSKSSEDTTFALSFLKLNFQSPIFQYELYNSWNCFSLLNKSWCIPN